MMLSLRSISRGDAPRRAPSALDVAALATAALLALGAAGCGGGGGGGSGQTAAAGATLAGTAVDSRVRNGAGDISAIGTTGTLTAVGSLSTDARGEYTFTLPSGFVGPIRLRLVSGEYTDGATGLPVNLSAANPLEAIANVSGTAPLVVNLNPFTTTAARLLDAAPPATFDAAAIDAVNEAVREAFALPGDINTTRPLDLLDPVDAAAFAADPGSPEARMGMLVGALAQVAANAPGGALSVPELAARFADDAADGVLDGAGQGGPIAGLEVDSATAGLAAGIAAFLTETHVQDVFQAESLPVPDPQDPAATALQDAVATNDGTVPLPPNPAAPPPDAITVVGLQQGFLNLATGAALDVEVALLGTALAGDVIAVSVIDTQATAAVTAQQTLTAGGAQTVTFAALDVSSLADGELRYRTTLTRGATTSLTIATTAQKDLGAPTTSITSPQDGDFVAGTVAATADAADARAIASVRFTFDDGAAPPVEVTDTTAPFAASLATAGLADGDATLTVTATDAAGNTATDAITVTIDNTAPTASIIDPADNDFVGGTFNVKADAADGLGAGPASVAFTLTQGAITSTVTDTTTPFAADFDTQALNLADGTATVAVAVTDKVGNVAASADSIAVRVDNTAPTGTITAPPANGFVRGTLAAEATVLDGAGSDVASVAFTLSQGAITSTVTDTTAPFAATFDTVVLALVDGDATLAIAATDFVGNVAATAASITVKIDNTAPTATVDAPAANDFVRATFATTASATDGTGSGVASVAFTLTQGAITSTVTDTTAPFEVSFDTVALAFADGDATLSIATADVIGNTAATAASITVKIDNTAPTATIDSPAANGFVRATFATTASATDGTGSGVASVAFTLTQGAITSTVTDTTAPFEVSFDTAALGLADGDATLSIATADVTGNTAATAASITVKVDNTAPTGTIDAPAANGFVRATFATTASATDGTGSGVALVAFTLSQGAITSTVTDTTAPFEVSFDTVALAFADGDATLSIATADVIGNTAPTAASITVKIDNTAPTATIDAPLANDFVRATFATTASATDGTGSGVALVAFTLTQGAITSTVTDTTAPFEVSFDTAALALVDGDATLSIATADVVGNTAATADSITVKVDNTAPTATIDSPLANDFVRATFATTASATDGTGSGVALVAFTLTQGAITTTVTDTTAPFEVSFDTAALAFADGDATLSIATADVIGNTAATADTITVKVDNTAPSVTAIELDGSPLVNGQAVQTLDVVTIEITDGAGSGVDTEATTVTITRGGSPLTEGADFTRTDGATSIDIAFTPDQDGSYAFAVTPADEIGNVGTTFTLTVIDDSVAPTGTITAPLDGAFVNALVLVQVTADDNVAVAKVDFEIEDGASTIVVASDTTAPFAATIDVTSLADGLATVTATISDTAGSTATDVVLVTIDTVGPDSVVVQPSDGDAVAGTVTFDVLTDDLNGVASVAFTLTDGVTTLAETDTTGVSDVFSVAFDTTLLADGPATLTLVVTDVAGNVDPSPDTIDVTVDNTAPVFDVQASNPPAGDLLSDDEARADDFFQFVFQDRDLDEAAVTVTINYLGQTLVDGTVGGGGNYTVDRSTPNTILVTLTSLGGIGVQSVSGDPLVVTLSGIEDTVGNTTGDVTLPVTVDVQAPLATSLDFVGNRNGRILVQFNEAMTPDDSGLLFLGGAAGADPIEGDRGFRTHLAANDIYFFTPFDLFEVGDVLTAEVNGFTDLAGNPVQNGNLTPGGTTVGGGFTPPPQPPIVEVRFVDTSGGGAGVTLDTIAVPLDVTNQAFLVDSAVAGTACEVHVEFDLDTAPPAEELNPFGFAGVESYLSDQDSFAFGLGTTASTNDTLLINQSGDITFHAGERFLLNGGVSTTRNVFTNFAFWFVVRKPASIVDVTPATVTALVGSATAAPGSATPRLRLEEPLLVGLSETIDLTALESGVNVTVRDSTGAIVDVGFVDPDKDSAGFLVRAANAATGALEPWAPGAYTIELENIPDLASTPNLMAATGPLAFEVAAAARTPAVVQTQPLDGDDRVDSFQVHVQFDDRMRTATLVDTGNPAIAPPGFRLDEEVLDAAGAETGLFVPKRGLVFQGDFQNLDPFRVADNARFTDALGLGTMRSGRKYELTLLAGAQNIDGVGLAAPAVAEFTVAEQAQVIPFVINEVDADQAGTDTHEFVELFDGGPSRGGGNKSLDGFVLVFFNGALADDPAYLQLDLDGFSTDAQGFFVVGTAALATDLGIPGGNANFLVLPGADNNIQNGESGSNPAADAVALLIGNVGDFPLAAVAAGSAALRDAVVYEGVDAALVSALTPGQPVVSEPATPAAPASDSAQRTFDGAGGNLQTSRFVVRPRTPLGSNGVPNVRPQINGGFVEVQVVVDDTLEVEDTPGVFTELVPFVELDAFWQDQNLFVPGAQETFAIEVAARSFPGGVFSVLAGQSGLANQQQFFFEDSGDQVTRAVGAGPLFLAGPNEVRTTLSDAAGDETSTIQRIHVPAESSIGAVTATVQVDGSVVVTGTVAAVDGPDVAFAQILVLTSNGVSGTNGLQVSAPPIYAAFATIVRDGTGALTYSATVPADALPPGTYAPLAEVTYFGLVNTKQCGSFAVAPPSAPFTKP